MIVTPATTGHVRDIVRVHCEAFPDFFLTSLGERFLARFYAAVVRHPAALSFVGATNGPVDGFVVGTLRPHRFFRELLLRQGLGFCRDALGAFVRRPWFVGRRLLRGLTYRGEAPAMRGDAALVSSIGVLRSAAGTGLAAALLDAFCAAAEARGAASIYLLTDRDDNPAANRFYLKAGFVLDAQITRSGKRPMNRYIRELQGHGPP